MFEVGDFVVKVLDDNRGGLKRECVREENLSFDVFSNIVHSRGRKSWTDMDQRHKSEPCGDLETSKKTLVSLI